MGGPSYLAAPGAAWASVWWAALALVSAWASAEASDLATEWEISVEGAVAEEEVAEEVVVELEAAVAEVAPDRRSRIP